MAKIDNTQSIDLSCKQVNENDVLTKDGQRTTFMTLYKGSVIVSGSGSDDDGEPTDSLVTVELKLKSDDKEALERCVPLNVGSWRKMELSLTNEDLDNHI